MKYKHRNKYCATVVEQFSGFDVFICRTKCQKRAKCNILTKSDLSTYLTFQKQLILKFVNRYIITDHSIIILFYVLLLVKANTFVVTVASDVSTAKHTF